MILNNTTRKLQVLLSEAHTTNALPVVASYFDSAAVPSGGPSLSNTNGTTAVDIVAAPAASTIRQVNEITVFNADTVSHGVTVRYNDNATLYSIIKATLAPGYTLTYSKALGWAVLSPTGLFIAGQIPGTSTNDSAAAGMVGEQLKASVSDVSPVSLGTSMTIIDIASQSFTAGDWDLSASFGFSPGTATGVRLLRAWMSTSSATQPSSFEERFTSFDFGAGATVSSSFVLTLPTWNQKFSTPTTVYLSARAQWTGGTPDGGFGHIEGIRNR